MAVETARQAFINMKGREVVPVGLVVADAAKIARRYAELFGIGLWRFLDIAPMNVNPHGKLLRDGKSCIRVAVAQLKACRSNCSSPCTVPAHTWSFSRRHCP
jgi:hypothetical protein